MSRSRVHLCVAAEDQARETATVTKKLLEFCCFIPHGFKEKKKNLVASPLREQKTLRPQFHLSFYSLVHV